MFYGYCRISTRKQSIERQIKNILAEFPKARIMEEVYTGTSMNREQWDKLMQKVKPGDSIVFDSVSRMSRTAKEGFATYKQLYDNDIKLIFLKEPHINTETFKQTLSSKVALTGGDVDIILNAVNEYLMKLAEKQIKLAFEQSEKEVADLRERTKEGIREARLRGSQIGREPGAKVVSKKSKECIPVIKEHSKSFGGNLSDVELMAWLKISRNTYYKYKKQIMQSPG